MKNRGKMMTYYQNADCDVLTPVRRRRYSDMDDDDMYTTAGVFPASRKALSISNKAMDEGDLRTSVSSRKDQQLLSDITAKLADIAQPIVVRSPVRRQAVHQTAPRAFTRRGMVVYPYTTLPDDVVYARRITRASSVPPSPVLSAADYDYVPMSSRRLEYPADDVMVTRYAPSYYSGGRSTYPAPASSASCRTRYTYRETSPVHEVSPSYTLNHLRVRATDARNKLDAHRTLLDRYLPEPMGDAQDVQSAVLYKYGELVDRMPSLEPYRPSRSASSGAASPTNTTRRDFSNYNNGGQTFRPQMSDTRKRLREVLCRTKGDPKYYAY